MSLPVVLLIFVLLSASALLLFFLARHTFVSRPEGLQKVLSQRRHLGESGYKGEDLLAALLLYEDRYPRFSALLQTILRAFPLERFVQQDGFRRAATELVGLLDGGDLDPKSVTLREKAAIAAIARVLLDDPEVQLRFGDPLRVLVDDFINELNG